MEFAMQSHRQQWDITEFEADGGIEYDMEPPTRLRFP
jgi:hypothetical protein